jgi:hypothetical protein
LSYIARPYLAYSLKEADYWSYWRQKF